MGFYSESRKKIFDTYIQFKINTAGYKDSQYTLRSSIRQIRYQYLHPPHFPTFDDIPVLTLAIKPELGQNFNWPKRNDILIASPHIVDTGQG